MMIWETVRPFLLLAAFGFWVYCLIDALQARRPWRWVVLLAFLPFVSAPFYFLNFWLSKDRRTGVVDSAVGGATELRKLEEEAKESPRPAIHLRLGEAYAERKRWKDALEQVGVVLDVDDEDLPAQYLAGRCLAELGKPENAAAHLDFVVREDSHYRSGAARTLFARCLAQIDRESEARFHLERAALEDRHPEAVVRHAQALLDEGNTGEAKELLDQLIEREAVMAEDHKAANREWLNAAREMTRKMEG